MNRRVLILAGLFACLSLRAFGASGQALTPLKYGPTPYGRLSPLSHSQVVRLGDGYLVTWVENGVRGMRIAADGRTLLDRAGIRYGGGWWYQVTTCGREALMLEPDGSSKYTLVRIHEDGSSAVVSDIETGLYPNTFAMADLNGSVVILQKWGGRLQAVVVDDLTGRILQKFAVTNTAAVGTGYSARDDEMFDVVATSAGFLMAWVNEVDGKIRVRKITYDQALAGNVTPDADERTMPGGGGFVRLATSGSASIVEWLERTSAGAELRIVPLGASGEPARSSPVVIAKLTNVPLSSPAVVWAGDRYICSLIQQNEKPGSRLASFRFGPDGSAVAPAEEFFTSAFFSPAVAAAEGRSGGVVVWTGTMPDGANTEVFAGPIDELAAGAAPTLVSLHVIEQTPEALFSMDGGRVALWSERVPNRQIFAGRLSASGTPLDDLGVRLSPTRNEQQAVSAASNGNRLLVRWVESQALHYAVIDVTTRPSVLASNTAGPALGDSTNCLWDGRQWVIVWSSYAAPEGVLASRVDAAGALLDTTPVVLIPNNAEKGVGVNPHLAWNGTEYLLAWQWLGSYCETPIPVCWTVYNLAVQRFSATLAPIGGPVALNGPPRLDDDSSELRSVAPGPGGWLVAWNDSSNTEYRRPRVLRLSSSGSLLDPVNGRDIVAADFILTAATGWLLLGGRQLTELAYNGSMSMPYLLTTEEIVNETAGAVAMNGGAIAIEYTGLDERVYVVETSILRRAVGR